MVVSVKATEFYLIHCYFGRCHYFVLMDRFVRSDSPIMSIASRLHMVLAKLGK